MYYIATVTREDKYWLAEFPDAPGCQTFADSSEELTEAAADALQGWLEGHLVDGQAPQRPQPRQPRQGDLVVLVPLALSAALSVRWKRQELGLSQAELAKRIGVTQQQIAKIEDPDENPTLKTVSTVAKALGLFADLRFVQPPPFPLPDHTADPAAQR